MNVFSGIDKELVAITNYNFAKNDRAHRIEHITDVAVNSVRIAEALNLDKELMVVAALCHDMCCHIDRATHHSLGSDWVSENLGKYHSMEGSYYNEEQVKLVAEMVYHHRASSKTVVYPNLHCEAFAAADRGILEIVAMIKRVSITDPAEIIHHLVDKFHPETGYAKLNSVHQKIFAKENEEFGTAIKELTIEKVIAILKS